MTCFNWNNGIWNIWVLFKIHNFFSFNVLLTLAPYSQIDSFKSFTFLPSRLSTAFILILISLYIDILILTTWSIWDQLKSILRICILVSVSSRFVIEFQLRSFLFLELVFRIVFRLLILFFVFVDYFTNIEHTCLEFFQLFTRIFETKKSLVFKNSKILL